MALSLTGLEQRVLSRWRARPASSHERLIVGFSGGPDSLALAVVLARLQPWLGVAVNLIHVDHGLRPESGREARRASELSQALELAFTSVRMNPELLAAHVNVGLEEAARRERYDALARVANSDDTSVLVTGHHLDDQAETVLLHLLRGAGPRGAAAMAEWTTITVPWWPDQRKAHRRFVWRPLLDESRSELENYLVDVRPDLDPIIDPSNFDLFFRRNQVRHDIMPILHEAFPRAAHALATYARIAADEDAYLENERLKLARNIVDAEGAIHVSSLVKTPVALQRRILRVWILERTNDRELSFERVESVRQTLLKSCGGWSVQLGKGWSAKRTGAVVRLVNSGISKAR